MTIVGTRNARKLDRELRSDPTAVQTLKTDLTWGNWPERQHLTSELLQAIA